MLRISAPDGATAGQANTRPFDAGQPIVLQRGDVQPGTSYTVQIQRGDLIEEWKWRMTTAQEASHVDEQLQEIERAIAVPAQRAVLTAMLFEQLRLRVNMDLLVLELRSSESVQR